ncbi:MAG: hypothetical protein EOO59_06415 [Hymenobacter sp.]|nr:MAG: hypothetical protein EOO59_06415 [Hymenobacter sp.]
MANHATLGHYLPYLLGHRLRAIVWPPSGGERALVLVLGGLMLLYGVGLGFVFSHAAAPELAAYAPRLTGGLYGFVLAAGLLNDFVPSLRPVVRPMPEHFPVSNRQCVVTAFLLDLLTLRRLLQVLLLVVAAVVAGRHALVPGLGLLLVLGTAAVSFGVRLLAALGRWRHPLLAGYGLALALAGWWLAHLPAPYAGWLGAAAVVLPWLLAAAQLYYLGPLFEARYLVVNRVAAARPGALGRLPLAWRVYGRLAWLPLLMGLLFKVVGLTVAGLLLHQGAQGFLYLLVLPTLSFMYVNNNLFGFLRATAANELQRLGLTPRLPALYLQLVGPVVVVECLVTAALILAVFPAAQWHLLGLVPLGAVALLSVGLWSSLYLAKPVVKAVDFANMRNNASTGTNLASLGLAAALFFVPSWPIRLLLAGLALVSVAWPLRQAWRNDGILRRRLWKGIGA